MAGKAKYPVIDGKKPCSKCGEVKPFDTDHFPSQPDAKVGRRLLSVCRVCRNTASLAWSKTDKGRDLHRMSEAKRREDPVVMQSCRDSASKYRLKNVKAVRARVRDWKAANPDRVHAWNVANADKIRAYSSRVRVKRAKAPGRHTAADLVAQFNAQGGACFYCAKPLTRFHIEHKTPLSRGGTNNPDNIVCACARCNLRKGPRTAEEFFAVLAADVEAKVV